MTQWLVAAIACTSPGPEVSVAGLVDELTDHEAVARWPRPAWRAALSSSSDGESDRGRYLGTWRGEHLLVDERGPGALVRLWSANPERGGTLRVYVDGHDDPVLAAPMAELLAGRGPVPD